MSNIIQLPPPGSGLQTIEVPARFRMDIDTAGCRLEEIVALLGMLGEAELGKTATSVIYTTMRLAREAEDALFGEPQPED